MKYAQAKLLLEDGTLISGRGFGAEGIRVGELVFTTGMVGYPESLTDPSYRGQILIFTHPMIGNYGVPQNAGRVGDIPIGFESDGIQVEGVVISRLTRGRHWSSALSLDEWLRREGVPGIEGVDTRALVKRLRERGVMKAVLAVGDYSVDEMRELLKGWDYESRDFVSDVAPKKEIVHEPEGGFWATVVVVDFGVKYGILRELLRRGVRVVRTPPVQNALSVAERYEAIGIVLSNGPGNPRRLLGVVDNISEILESEMPVLGICLGNQLLAMADGARVYKLKYGHRGQNKPVRDVRTGRAFVTSQNHGYAVDAKTLRNFELWMVNVDDGTVEALLHRKLPAMATQFHPEASPGPVDASWIFDKFLEVAVAWRM